MIKINRYLLLVISVIILVCCGLQSRGSKVCDTKSIVYILGASKDMRIDDMMSLQSNINIIGKSFCQFKIILYVDPLSYTTISKEWGKMSNLKLLNETYSKSPRTLRLAVARNILLNETNKMVVARGDSIKNVYIAMMDLDYAMIRPINKMLFQTVLHNSNQWDIVTFNSYIKYYDIWALRYKRFDINFMAHGNPVLFSAIQEDIIRQLKESVSHYYPVISAFNGLGIYKYNYTIGCKYDGNSLESGNSEDCEHVGKFINMHICLCLNMYVFYIIIYI